MVTDVGSVKAAPLEAVRARVGADDLTRYVGVPPDGRQRAVRAAGRLGAALRRAALGGDRHETSSREAEALVVELAALCGATPVCFSPEEHDQAVARTSHLPHVVAALIAGALADAPATHLSLSGQGVRDVTRIAAGDPGCGSRS